MIGILVELSKIKTLAEVASLIINGWAVLDEQRRRRDERDKRAEDLEKRVASMEAELDKRNRGRRATKV